VSKSWANLKKICELSL